MSKEILEAYLAWVSISTENLKGRDDAWERYVAIRDGKAPPSQPKEKKSAQMSGNKIYVQ